MDRLALEPTDLVGRAALLGGVPNADRLDLEPIEPFRDGLSDRAEADDRDGTAGQFAGLEVSPLVVLLPSPALVEPPGEDEHVTDHPLGDTRGVDAARVREGHPTVRERLDSGEELENAVRVP